MMRTAFLVAAVALAGCLEANTSDHSKTALDLSDVTLDAEALLEDLQVFATHGERRANGPEHLAARDWLEVRLADAGLDVWRQDFNRDLDQQNIVGIQWGDNRDEWIVVGAHYDTYHRDCIAADRAPEPAMSEGCPGHAASNGAYDDGSGVAMTLHLADNLAQLSSYYTIAYVLFDGEERGLQGSGAFAEAITNGDHDFGPVILRAMLDLDMFGINWPGTEAPIDFIHNSPALAARVDALREEKGAAPEMVRFSDRLSGGGSDYASFMAIDVPTGFFISDFSTWQLPGGVPLTTDAGNYPFWHLADTYDTMLMMAGSQEALEAGFANGLDFALATLEVMADPSQELTIE